MKLKRIISSVFFPERCRICGKIKPFLKPYCPECGVEGNLISPYACPECGHEKCICGEKIFLELTHFTSVYYYHGQIKKSILDFKFNSESSYADIFGKAMADKMKSDYADILFDGVCFVPMTKENERIRGYNQSELLGAVVAKEMKLPLIPCLKKEKTSASQKKLSAKERAENLKGSFTVCGDIRGKVLILCDDIRTTGSTLKECSDTLMKAGAKDVYCLTLAMTLYKHRHIL